MSDAPSLQYVEHHLRSDIRFLYCIALQQNRMIREVLSFLERAHPELEREPTPVTPSTDDDGTGPVVGLSAHDSQPMDSPVDPSLVVEETPTEEVPACARADLPPPPRHTPTIQGQQSQLQSLGTTDKKRMLAIDDGGPSHANFNQSGPAPSQPQKKLTLPRPRW